MNPNREKASDAPRTFILGGRVIDPASERDEITDILLANGRVAAVGPEAGSPQPGDRVIDAQGLVVCPGFIDMHAHEDPLDASGRCAVDEDRANLACLLRMGVTTALTGNCGDNFADPVQFMDAADREGCTVNVLMLAGYTYFREQFSRAGFYAPASEEEIGEITAALRGALAQGCAGISFGLEYVPGISQKELLAAAALCAEGKGRKKLVAAHIRACAEQAVPAAEEILCAGEQCGVPVEISHIGSMAGYGQMAAFLQCIDDARAKGIDAACDCYPYDAFSTFIGSAPYDDLEAIHCSYEDIEMSEGAYKGQRCTREIFEAERRDHPDYLTVGHAMKDSEIRLAYLHPGVMVGSDCFLSNGEGHPRAAGAFPRFFRRYTGEGGLTLPEAVRRVTELPARRLGLTHKGTLAPGADADVVIFDPAALRDCATFEAPTLPPEGIRYVLLGGRIAVEGQRIVCPNLGRAIRC